jgi:hypothetical protein
LIPALQIEQDSETFTTQLNFRRFFFPHAFNHRFIMSGSILHNVKHTAIFVVIAGGHKSCITNRVPSELYPFRSVVLKQGVAVTYARIGVGGRTDMQNRAADWRLGHQETKGISSINLGASILQSSNSISTE